MTVYGPCIDRQRQLQSAANEAHALTRETSRLQSQIAVLDQRCATVTTQLSDASSNASALQLSLRQKDAVMDAMRRQFEDMEKRLAAAESNTADEVSTRRCQPTLRSVFDGRGDASTLSPPSLLCCFCS